MYHYILHRIDYGLVVLLSTLILCLVGVAALVIASSPSLILQDAILRFPELGSRQVLGSSISMCGVSMNHRSVSFLHVFTIYICRIMNFRSLRIYFKVDNAGYKRDDTEYRSSVQR